MSKTPKTLHSKADKDGPQVIESNVEPLQRVIRCQRKSLKRLNGASNRS